MIFTACRLLRSQIPPGLHPWTPLGNFYSQTPNLPSPEKILRALMITIIIINLSVMSSDMPHTPAPYSYFDKLLYTVDDISLPVLIAHFYSASALPTMQTAVLARGILSVCPYVCPSITFQCFVQTNEDTIVRFSASGMTIILVSGEVKFIWIFARDHPQRGH